MLLARYICTSDPITLGRNFVLFGRHTCTCDSITLAGTYCINPSITHTCTSDFQELNVSLLSDQCS